MQYRSPIKVLVLGILTLGFYDLYWLGTTSAELEKNTHIEMRSALWLFFILLSRLACTASIVWLVLTLLIDSLSSAEGMAWMLLIITAILGFIANSLLLARWLMPYVRAVQLTTNGAVQESNAMLLLLTREPYGITALQQAYNNPKAVPDFMSKDITVVAKAVTNKSDQLENPILKRILTLIAIVMIIGLILLLLFPFLVTHIG